MGQWARWIAAVIAAVALWPSIALPLAPFASTATGAATGSISLAISCFSSPERSTITNNTDQILPLGQVRLGSLYQPRAGEPYTLGNTSVLLPGQAITFQTGPNSEPGPDSPRLTDAAIYSNDAASEGARLETPYGILTVLCSAGSGTLAVSAPGETCRTFGETGKRACGRFLEYWIANGGLAQQGYPITDEFEETNPTDGRRYRVQYFERARFEYHPENAPPFDVLLGLLGREQYRARYPGAPPPPFPGDPFNNPAYPQECADFAQTGQRVCSLFLAYWRANGGLAQQGLPLTGVILETNPTDGKTYPTQYFERARFEFHEEIADPRYKVLLGLLGREQFLTKYPSGVPGGGASPAPSASPLPVASPRPSPPTVPSPSPTTNPRAGCDPAYPTVCIPPAPPDLDCGQISHRNFPVNKPDPHRLDSDGDGIGCES
jgi:hypothetical protein